MLFLLMTIAYQVPLMPCPFFLNKTPFLSRAECVEQEHSARQSLGDIPDEWYAWWYAMVLQFSGVVKLENGWSDVGGVAKWYWLVALCSLLHACAVGHYGAVMELEFCLLRERLQRIREMRFCDNIVSRRNVERKMQAAKHSVLLHRLVRVQKLTFELENIWNNKRPHFSKTELTTRDREHLIESVALKGGDDYAASQQILHVIVQAYEAHQNGSGNHCCDLNDSSSVPVVGQTDLLLSHQAVFEERAVRYLKATRAHALGFITEYELEEEKRMVLDFSDADIGKSDADGVDEESPNSSEEEKAIDSAVSTSEVHVQGSDGIPSDAATHPAGDLRTCLLRSILGPSWVQRAALFLSDKLEYFVTDTLFITTEHEALPQHRKLPPIRGGRPTDGANGAVTQCKNGEDAHEDVLRVPRHCWHMALKVLLSSTLFFVTLSGILTFTAFPSIVSLIMALSVVLFLAIFPFAPIATWSGLFVVTLLIVSVKTLYQCPFISYMSSDNEKVTQNVLALLFGLLKAAPTSSDGGGVLRYTISILWADYLFLVMLSLHIMALRLRGLHLHDRRTLLARLREQGTDALIVAPPFAARESTTERNDRVSPIPPAREASTRESKPSNTSEALLASQMPPLLLPGASIGGAQEEANPPHLRDGSDDRSVPSWVERITGAQVRKPVCDLYGVRFFLSALCFLWLLFLWSNMAGGQSIKRALETNNFSAAQVVVLLAQVMLMVSDRVLYTCHNSDLKNIIPSGKMHKQYAHLATRVLLILQLVVLHGFMLAQIVRQVRSTTVGKQWAEQISLWHNSSQLLYYVTYMAYLCVCSLQCAYDSTAINPSRLFGLTEQTDVTSKCLFVVFTAIPFLQEFRVMADWSVTCTSMDWMAWFKLEDAMNNLYLVKYDMQRRVYGQARPFVTEKLLQGICFLLVMVFLLLAPILFFATLNQLQSSPARITDGELQIGVTVRSTANNRSANLYSSHQTDIYEYQDTDIPAFENKFPSVNLRTNELNIVQFPEFSDDIWMISPALKRKMFDIVHNYTQNNSNALKIIFELKYTLHRTDMRLKSTPDATKKLTSECSYPNSGLSSSDRERCDGWVTALLAAFRTNHTSSVPLPTNITINIYELYQRFIHLTDTMVVKSLSGQKKDDNPMLDLALIFHPGSQTAGVGQACATSAGSTGAPDMRSSLMETMEGYWELNTKEKNMPSKEFRLDAALEHISFGTGGNGTFSVIGLYLGVVLTIGRFLRYMTKDISKRVIYEEMRDPDLFLDLGAGIYISRLHGDLHTETVLYQQLIKLFRSPEMLLYITGDASAQFRGSICDAAESSDRRRTDSQSQL